MASSKVGVGQVWKRKDSGHAICGTEDGEIRMQVFTVVGKVSEANLFVDGLGGWSHTWENTTMDKAKFQFQVERPVGYPTDDWPVDDAYDVEFFQLGEKMLFTPLTVIDDAGHRVGPKTIADTLRNSIVEVHFVLRHFKVKNNKDQWYDSFTAYPQKVLVINLGRTLGTMKFITWRDILQVSADPSPQSSPARSTTGDHVAQAEHAPSNQQEETVKDEDMRAPPPNQMALEPAVNPLSGHKSKTTSRRAPVQKQPQTPVRAARHVHDLPSATTPAPQTRAATSRMSSTTREMHPVEATLQEVPSALYHRIAPNPVPDHRSASGSRTGMSAAPAVEETDWPADLSDSQLPTAAGEDEEDQIQEDWVMDDGAEEDDNRSQATVSSDHHHDMAAAVPAQQRTFAGHAPQGQLPVSAEYARALAQVPEFGRPRSVHGGSPLLTRHVLQPADVSTAGQQYLRSQTVAPSTPALPPAADQGSSATHVVRRPKGKGTAKAHDDEMLSDLTATQRLSLGTPEVSTMTIAWDGYESTRANFARAADMLETVYENTQPTRAAMATEWWVTRGTSSTPRWIIVNVPNGVQTSVAPYPDSHFLADQMTSSDFLCCGAVVRVVVRPERIEHRLTADVNAAISGELWTVVRTSGCAWFTVNDAKQSWCLVANMVTYLRPPPRLLLTDVACGVSVEEPATPRNGTWTDDGQLNAPTMEWMQ
uniref:Uncharacterized protein n=1 Tax=Mycena chlorophos TaxID=658473 RepID=A0ABQ0KZG6_MYCCL|nr:predicted protein [Mycena chlorophos]